MAITGGGSNGSNGWMVATIVLLILLVVGFVLASMPIITSPIGSVETQEIIAYQPDKTESVVVGYNETTDFTDKFEKLLYQREFLVPACGEAISEYLLGVDIVGKEFPVILSGTWKVGSGVADTSIEDPLGQVVWSSDYGQTRDFEVSIRRGGTYSFQIYSQAARTTWLDVLLSWKEQNTSKEPIYSERLNYREVKYIILVGEKQKIERRSFISFLLGGE